MDISVGSSNGTNSGNNSGAGTGNGGGGSGGMCTFTMGSECSAGGGHTSSAGCVSGDGWSLTVTVPCPPNVSSSRNSQNARGGDIVNPCDGDVALLFDIIDFDETWLPYPCQKDIVIEALSVSSVITDSISNVFSSERVHITNKIQNFSPNWTPFAKTEQDIGVSSIITYDTDFIESATDLFMVSAAQHESFHALLNYLVLSGNITVNDPNPDINTLVQAFLSALNDNDPDTDTNGPTHQYMATIISQFKNSIKTYGESKGYVISDEYYENLAWIGLTDTAAFNSIYESEAANKVLEISAVTSAEYNDYPEAKGNKCQN